MCSSYKVAARLLSAGHFYTCAYIRAIKKGPISRALLAVLPRTKPNEKISVFLCAAYTGMQSFISVLPPAFAWW